MSVPVEPMPRGFFARSARVVARALLGHTLIRQLADGTQCAGVIVETEAYLGVRDRAAHSFAGRRTPRNEAMYGPAGHAYVYFTYGMHHCVNVVCATPGTPEAVLIRALEPLAGLAAMHAARPAAVRPRDLCSGPGKLCQALQIDRRLNGADLCTPGPLVIGPRPSGWTRRRIMTGPRIGIGYAGEWIDRPLRFWVADNPHVSVRRVKTPPPRRMKRS